MEEEQLRWLEQSWFFYPEPMKRLQEHVAITIWYLAVRTGEEPLGSLQLVIVSLLAQRRGCDCSKGKDAFW